MYTAVIILIFVVWTAAGFAWFLRMASILQRNNDLDRIGNFKGSVFLGLGGPAVWLAVFAIALKVGFKKVANKNSRFYNWLIR